MKNQKVAVVVAMEGQGKVVVTDYLVRLMRMQCECVFFIFLFFFFSFFVVIVFFGFWSFIFIFYYFYLFLGLVGLSDGVMVVGTFYTT